MSEVVTLRQVGRVGLVTIDNPPVNALGHAVRAGLMAALDRAAAAPEIGAVVLVAAGRTFPAGADIREFGQPPRDPWLPEVCDRIEGFAKPVIACLHGTALGGGCELALAAHWRLAAAGAQIGLPEVTLGILPGAGGTLRAPRLAGAKAALDLMLSGKPVGAARAAEMGLIDGVVQGDLTAAGLALAEELIAGGAAPRPTRARAEGMADPAAYMAEIAARRRAVARAPVPAERRIVDCVEAALLLPFEVAQDYERAAFEECLASPESRALRHAFLAERRAAKVPELASGRPREILRAGVVGGGTMGAGIAVALLDAGLPVVLSERSEEALAAALGRIEGSYLRAVGKGRLSEEEAGARLARLEGTVALGPFAGCDLAIEAVFEDIEAKRAVFAALDRVLPPGAILATNTSYLDVDALAAGTGRPGEVIGLHFFSPAHVMRLLEVVPGAASTADTVATAFALARRLGKIAVRAGVTDGFIGNRVLTACRTACDFLLEEGASPAEVDAAMRAAGYPLGPYEVADLAGLDISWARRKRLAATRDPAARYVAIGDRLCEAGRLGQKTGAGYYRYPAGARSGVPDPEVGALIEAERARKGIVPRAVPAAEIRRRAFAAMANEGARLVAEGIALRPSDVDVVMLHGYAFPRWLGGPMQWADEAGLLALRNDLRAWAAEEPAFWTPSPLWDELIKNGWKFADLNGV